jgi:hypothetical protein
MVGMVGFLEVEIQIPDAKGAEVAQKTQKRKKNKRVACLKLTKREVVGFIINIRCIFCAFGATSASFASGMGFAVVGLKKRQNIA